MEATRDGDPQVRAEALSSLASLGAQQEDVFEALLAGLDDRNAEVRCRCAWGLVHDQAWATRAGLPLRRLLHDKDTDVLRSVLQILKEKHLLDPANVPELIVCLCHNNDSVRSLAAEDLGELGPNARAAVPTLRKALKDPSDSVRWWSATALGNIGSAANEAVPDLKVALKDEEFPVKRHATEALQKIEASLNAEKK
jgi:HEAT repeat protein